MGVLKLELPLIEADITPFKEYDIPVSKLHAVPVWDYGRLPLHQLPQPD